jgi:hypothetical protein
LTEHPLERMLQEDSRTAEDDPMAKSNAALANVIDLEAFRQKKMRGEESRASDETSPPMRDAAMLVPVWFCWVPVWAPMS